MKRQNVCLLMGRSQLSCGVVRGASVVTLGGVGSVCICPNVSVLQLSGFILLLVSSSYLKWQKESRCTSITLKSVLEWGWKLCHQSRQATWGHCFSAAVRQWQANFLLYLGTSAHCEPDSLLCSSSPGQIFVTDVHETSVTSFFLPGEISSGYFTGKTRCFLWEVDAEMDLVVQEVYWE